MSFVIGHLSLVIRHWVQEFDSGLTLQQQAQAMKAIGCYEAMNLDGGASKAFAANSKILVPAGRLLTNVIVVYDAKNPAALQQSWVRFQKGDRPMIPDQLLIESAGVRSLI